MICLKKKKKNAKVELEGVAPVFGKLHPLEPGKFLSYLFFVFTYFQPLEPGKFTFCLFSRFQVRRADCYHLYFVTKDSVGVTQLPTPRFPDKGKDKEMAKLKDKKIILFFSLLLF